MTTTKNEKTELQEGVNAALAELGNPMRQLQSVMKRRASEATKPPASPTTHEPTIRQKIAAHLATHRPTPKPLAPAETPFMRGLRLTVEIQKRIANDNARWLAEHGSQPVVATPEEVLDQRCLVAEQPVPVPPAPRIIAVPVMVGRLGRH